jgi:hydroxymethylpyrimidine pyrophosphatase-like HAD family hydrolase
MMLASMRVVHPETDIWLLTARGKNKDILQAASLAVNLEPRCLASCIATTGSALEKALRALPHGEVFTFQYPGRKDGFLATNSLLATMVLFYRAYSAARSEERALPRFAELLQAQALQERLSEVQAILTPILKCTTILSISSAHTSIGSIDLESKTSEAGLVATLSSDLRNFAHGRHNWLSKRGTNSGILFLVDSASETLATRTAKLLPATSKSSMIITRQTGMLSEIESCIQAFIITAVLGDSRGIDPGRPGVAAFGSRIYNLSIQKPVKVDFIARAIDRKVAAGTENATKQVAAEAHKFLSRLQGAPIRGIVLDLDGTLLDEKSRWGTTCRPDLAEEIDRLLQYGLRVGIATGRNRGTTTGELLKSLISPQYRDQVPIAYHNGAFVESLSGVMIAKPIAIAKDRIDQLLHFLKEKAASCSREISIRHHATQITLRSEHQATFLRADVLFQIAQEAISETEVHARVVRSSVSVDIIAHETTKLRILEALGAGAAGILRIGDMGAWPGNDFELLSSELGLSVWQVSAALNSCWNMLPSGIRGTDGTLQYLRSIKLTGRKEAVISMAT